MTYKTNPNRMLIILKQSIWGYLNNFDCMFNDYFENIIANAFIILQIEVIGFAPNQNHNFDTQLKFI